MGDIEYFKAFLQYGISRPHSYKVRIQSPSRGISEEVGIMCEDAEIPGKSFATGIMGLHGPEIKYPYREIFTDLRLNFILSSDFWERFWMDEWQNKIVNPKSGFFYYPDEYTRDLVIQQLDGNGRIVYEGVAKKAWPVTIDPMQLSYKAQNTYHTMTVTFAYTRFLDTLTDGTSNGDSGVSGSRSPGKGGTGTLPTPGSPVDQ